MRMSFFPKRFQKNLAPAVRRVTISGSISFVSFFALISAEELGITQANVDEMRKNPPNPRLLVSWVWKKKIKG